MTISSLGSFRDLKGLLAESDNIDDDADIPYKVRERSHRLCYSFLGGSWKKCKINDMILKRVKGGMTNMLFLCKLPDHIKPSQSEPHQVLMRVYFNPETEAHLVSESVIFTLLSERHLGPRLYGIFNGGRLEEYIPSRPLSCSELANHSLSMKIAQRLARIHQLDVPISKEATYMIDVLGRWLTQLVTIYSSSKPLNQLTSANGTSIDDSQWQIPPASELHNELDFVKDCLQQSTSKVVFCHNDLQEGNILLPTTTSNIRNNSFDVHDDSPQRHSLCVPKPAGPNTSRLVLIDFEYASYNYRAFDFANHFCEWTFDYDCSTPPYFMHKPESFPSNQQMKDFFRSYLIGSDLDHDDNEHGIGLTHREITDDVLNSMVKETLPFVAMSHYFWGVWALLQVELSPVEFGFAEYGRKRLQCYYDTKCDLTALLKE